MRKRLLLPAIVAALVTAAGLLTAGSGPVAAAVPATIPLKISNNSGRGDALYIYNLGTNLSTGQQGWADSAGNFHAWPAGGNPPTPAPDASIAGPANGQSITIQMPKFSGRVWFSYGQKLVFKLTTGGLVQPAVQNPSDPNRNILFSSSEYTLNDAGLWINSTQVDMFSIPYAVGVQPSGGGAVKTTGHLKPGGYNAFFNSLRSQPGGWSGAHPHSAERFRTARSGSPVRRGNRRTARERDGRLHQPGLVEVQLADPDSHAVHRPAEHQVLRPGVGQHDELHQRRRPDGHVVPEA